MQINLLFQITALDISSCVSSNSFFCVAEEHSEKLSRHSFSTWEELWVDCSHQNFKLKSIYRRLVPNNVIKTISNYSVHRRQISCNALFLCVLMMESKRGALSPPSSISLINDDLFTLSFPFQIKSNKIILATVTTSLSIHIEPARYINIGITSVFTI